MNLETKNLKDIINNIKINENYQNILLCLKTVLDSCYYSKHLFYTIEYIDIIMNDNKVDNSLVDNFNCDLQKMLLYILKNKNVKFDKEYFDILIELSKLDTTLEYNLTSKQFELSNKKDKISPKEYNRLLFTLSIDYTNPYRSECDDFLFTEVLNAEFYYTFTNLIDTYSYYKPSRDLFVKLTKYSPIISNAILKNSEYIDELQDKKLKIDKDNDFMFILEYNLFIILVEIFISRAKYFDYDYSLITLTIRKIMAYIKDDYIYRLDDFQITNDDLEYLKQCVLDILYGLNNTKKKMN